MMRKWFGLLMAGVLASAFACAQAPLHLQADEPAKFHFAVYGDARFTDPSDHEKANPDVRQALVKAIAEEHPAFLCFGGDIVLDGSNANDWQVYDRETKAWRDQQIRVFPALGNHDLHGSLETALGNYFRRYPELQRNRYYSVTAGSVLLLALDSSLSETDGPQGDWLRAQLEHLPASVEFVVLLLHHPPYTSSSDANKEGGHSARASEEALANYLESKQANLRARIVVFAGHVHNYERHQHGGVTYFVSGGGGARPYPVERTKTDLFQGSGVNYHYLQVEVQPGKMTITMRRLELQDGAEKWSTPDHVELEPARVASAAR